MPDEYEIILRMWDLIKALFALLIDFHYKKRFALWEISIWDSWRAEKLSVYDFSLYFKATITIFCLINRIDECVGRDLKYSPALSNIHVFLNQICCL